MAGLADQGWGLLSQFPPFRYFSNFSASPKCMLAIAYHVHIWQVLPQLSCGDTCQIWMNRYFDSIKNFAYGEINERSFSNPHPKPNLWEDVPLGSHWPIPVHYDFSSFLIWPGSVSQPNLWEDVPLDSHWPHPCPLWLLLIPHMVWLCQ